MAAVAATSVALSRSRAVNADSQTVAASASGLRRSMIDMAKFRTVILLVSTVLLVGGCYSENNPDTGRITIYNDSDETIVLLTGAPPRLEIADAVGQGKTLTARPPGASYDRFFSQMDNVDWCEAPLRVYWIVRTDLDISIHGSSGPFDPDEFEVLETIGPNICWGERNAEYHYTGD